MIDFYLLDLVIERRFTRDSMLYLSFCNQLSFRE